jgi:decaprenylphospho-beta-D-ribofuranose 2-oxidase
MFSQRKRILSFGRNLAIKANVFQPTNVEQLREAVTDCTEITARGNARSYGDAALGREVVDTRKLNQILDFQADTGLITCQSGVLLEDVLQFCVPKGWFLKVTPGIKSITVGGAVASDVHGKNHRASGNFSTCVRGIQMMDKLGEVRNCSRTENPDLFSATFGAMGTTGVITEVCFELMPITSTQMEQRVQVGRGLSNLLERMWQSTATYNAAWLNLLAEQNTQRVQFVLYSAEHAASGGLAWKPKSGLMVPFTPPFRVLLSPLMRLYNAQIWKKGQKQAEKPHFVDLDTYFYPLDSLRNWNYLYGPRGFYQYQFCIPKAAAEPGLAQVFEALKQSAQKPYLAVMKTHGPADPGFPNSFPLEGYSLALDFPANKATERLVEQLDEIVWTHGGKIYLAKDALSRGRMARLSEDSLKPWQHGFGSLLFDRIKQDLP